MRFSLYQVDAFTQHVFGGNPAAVCPLGSWPDDARLQAIAQENNLSETAFFVPSGDDFELRWFTPCVEVDLCGHATLAAARVVFDHVRPELGKVRFHTRSGLLTVVRRERLLEMDFPVRPAKPCEAPPGLLAGLAGAPEPREVLRSQRDYLVVYGREADVRAIRPQEAELLALDLQGVIATAPGDRVDFVSRFFAPSVGILEDPVTGSAHCVSTPYWAERLGRERLEARQVSARGGALTCTLRGDRVAIAGHAVLYLEGNVAL